MARLLSRSDLLVLLVLTAAVAGACSASTTPASGAASSTRPPATPSPTLAVGSLPPASALPSNLFPCDLSPSWFVVSLHTPHGIVDGRGLAAPAASPAQSATAAPTAIANAGELVGGQTYTADFALDLGATRQPVAPTAIQASTSLPGVARPATVHLQGTSAGISIPDGKGQATLALALTIANDPCPDLFATVQVAFRLVPAATAAACPTGQPGYVRLIQDLDPRLTFAGVTRAFTVQSFVARYVNVAGSDQIPPFAGYNPTAPAATAGKGRAIAITSAAKGMTLTAGNVQLWRRADVVGKDGRLRTATGEPIGNDDLKATGGRITWAGPTRAGDYVAGLLPTWTQACMTGSGYVFLSLTVT